MSESEEEIMGLNYVNLDYDYISDFCHSGDAGEHGEPRLDNPTEVPVVEADWIERSYL